MPNLSDFVPFANRAVQESSFSGLPGRGNGPADAYRHMLWAAEVTASLKNTGLSDDAAAAIARNALGLHESDLLSTPDPNPLVNPYSHQMDLQNNEIGIQVGLQAPGSYEQRVTLIRDSIFEASQASNLTVPPPDANSTGSLAPDTRTYLKIA